MKPNLFTIFNFLPLVVAAAGLSGLAPAQDTEIDIQARERSIPVLEQRIADRETQIGELAGDILKFHQRLDGKLGRMVERLASIKDSAKSGYRVGKVKMEVIDGLKETVEAFVGRRASLERELQNEKSGLPRESVEAEIDHFDAHVDQHIEQMLELSKSFTRDQNVEKYESVGGAGYYDNGLGWYEESVEISDEWRQNRRDRTMDKKQRGEVLGALENSIERCDSRIAGLRGDLKNESLSSFERQVIQSELDAHLSMRRKRGMQKEELLVVEQQLGFHLREGRASIEGAAFSISPVNTELCA